DCGAYVTSGDIVVRVAGLGREHEADVELGRTVVIEHLRIGQSVVQRRHLVAESLIPVGGVVDDEQHVGQTAAGNPGEDVDVLGVQGVTAANGCGHYGEERSDDSFHEDSPRETGHGQTAVY